MSKTELCERLLSLRKNAGMSQEKLAESLGVSRQTVGKWETGQAVPELSAIIKLSGLYNVSTDRILKDSCASAVENEEPVFDDDFIDFLIKAKKKTYAGHGGECSSSRPASHDLSYTEGDLMYYDTYLGGRLFSGEEAVWKNGVPVWSMNYIGRVTGENFSGDFLKEALCEVPEDMPYRGPGFYLRGDYSYHCIAEGSPEWFRGYEEIFCCGEKIYELFFHGGSVVQ